MSSQDHIFHFKGNLAHAMDRVLLTWTERFKSLHWEHNIVRLNLAGMSAWVLEQELTTPPFFAEKRLILIDGSLDESLTKQKNLLAEKDWGQVFDNIPESNVIGWIRVDQGFSWLSDILNTRAQTKIYSIDSPEDVHPYLAKELPDLPVRLRNLLAERLWDNTLLLENEVEKLSLLEDITESDIRENTIETTEIKVFAVGDAIVAGNIQWAIGLIRLSLGTTDLSEFLRGSSIGAVRKKWFLAVLREIWLYAALAIAGVPARERISILWIKDFVGDKYARIPPNRLKLLVQLYEDMSEIDRLLKTGKLVGEEEWIQHQMEATLLRYNFGLQAK